jgi:hypothetical protein
MTAGEWILKPWILWIACALVLACPRVVLACGGGTAIGGRYGVSMAEGLELAAFAARQRWSRVTGNPFRRLFFKVRPLRPAR